VLSELYDILDIVANLLASGTNLDLEEGLR